MYEILNIIGAAGTMAMGLIGLLSPQWAAKITGLQADTDAGQSEFRATYGGLFIALGLVPLVSMEPIAFAVTGAAWLLTGIGRIMSIVVDQVSNPTNWGGVAFEFAFAAALLVGAPIGALLALT